MLQMYNRVRQRILERQCIDLLHELAGRPDAPQDVTEQGFAMEVSPFIFLMCYFFVN